MKFLVVSMALGLVFNAFAKIESGSIKNLNLSYSDPSGTASAEEFQFGELNFGDSPKFEVEKQAGSIFIKSDDQEFEIADLPLLNDLHNIDMKSVNIMTDDNQVSVGLKSIKSENQDKRLSVGTSSFNCKYSEAPKGDDVMDACLNNSAVIKTSFFRLTEGGSNTSLNNVRMYVNKNRLSLYMKYKVNIKALGYVYYTPDQIRIKLNKIKTGFISIKGKVFKELKSLESDKVKVNMPWITIDLTK